MACFRPWRQGITDLVGVDSRGGDWVPGSHTLMQGMRGGPELRLAFRAWWRGRRYSRERESEQRNKKNRGHYEGVHVHLSCQDRVDMHNVQLKFSLELELHDSLFLEKLENHVLKFQKILNTNLDVGRATCV
jgi:hypothetical protein